MYDFKPVGEFVRAIALTVIVSLLQSITALDPSVLANPETWFHGVLVAAALAGAHAALRLFTGKPSEV